MSDARSAAVEAAGRGEGERSLLEAGLAALESQRPSLGDAVVDAMLVPIRARIEALGRTSAPPERRSVVTVLFADVCGFSTISERLDEELLRDAINRLWAELDGAVERRGGRIDKHLGDGLMALWGSELSREDDAERAVLAALEMQRLVAALRPEAAPPLTIRVGVNTGPAMLGPVGRSGEFTAMGDSVNVAARLQAAAPVGGVLIAASTAQFLRGDFDLREIPPLSVKGRVEPVRAFVVSCGASAGTRSGGKACRDGVGAALVGRAAELRALEEELERALARRELRAVTLVGEAGLGKSRIAAEFEARSGLLMGGLAALRARASESRRGQPYGLVADLLAARFRLPDAEDAERAIELLERGFAELLPGDRSAPEKARLAAGLAGFALSPESRDEALRADGPQFRQLAFMALSALVAAEAAAPGRSGLVLVFEDLHWADEGSIAFIEWLAARPLGSPVLLLALARPELLRARPSWSCGPVIALESLPAAESEELGRRLLAPLDGAPPELVRLIADRSEGNPYYAEEIVRMLFDRRVLVRRDEAWSFEPARLRELSIPPTLAGLILSRLETVPEEGRRILRLASVVGRSFWDGALEAASGLGPEQVGKSLEVLAREGFVSRRGESSRPGCREYAFRHAILRDVVYGTILLRERREAHRAVARWWEGRSAAWGEEQAAVVALHYELAGLPVESAAWYDRAAALAEGSWSGPTALRHLEKCLELFPAGLARGRARLRRARILAREGRWEEARAEFEELSSSAEPADRRSAEAEALEGLAGVLFSLGKVGEALSAAGGALEAWRALASSAGMARAEFLVAEIRRSLGEGARAEEGYRRARALAEEAGDLPATAAALSGLALSAYDAARYEDCAACSERALALRRRIGDRQGAADALSTLSLARFALGETSACAALREECLAIRREIGDRAGIARALNNLGIVAFKRGDYAGAERSYEEALAIKRAIGDRRGVFVSLNNLGLVATDRGDYETARLRYGEALALSEALGHRAGVASVLANLGDLALERGFPAEAAAFQEKALEIRRGLGDQRGEAEALVGLGAVRRLYGDRAEAVGLLERALALYREANYRPGIAVALAELGFARAEELGASRSDLLEALSLAEESEDSRKELVCLAGIVCLASRGDEPEEARDAAALAAFVEARTRALGLVVESRYRKPLEAAVERLRLALRDGDFDAARRRGESLGLAEALGLARGGRAGRPLP